VRGASEGHQGSCSSWRSCEAIGCIDGLHFEVLSCRDVTVWTVSKCCSFTIYVPPVDDLGAIDMVSGCAWHVRGMTCRARLSCAKGLPPSAMQEDLTWKQG